MQSAPEPYFCILLIYVFVTLLTGLYCSVLEFGTVYYCGVVYNAV